MGHDSWIDKYLRTHYVGYMAGNYEHGCPLYFKDINNFIQNVGRYGDVEIVRAEDGDTLLNTAGFYINRIWPDMSNTLRTSNETINNVNYIAYKFQEIREKDGEFPEPLPKVKRFMKEVLGQEFVDNNESLHAIYIEEALEEQAIEESVIDQQTM